MINKPINRSTLKNLRALANKERFLLLLIIAIGSINSIFLIIQWYYLSQIVFASFIKKTAQTDLKFSFLIMFSLIILRVILNITKEHLSFNFSKKIRTSLREKIIERVTETGPIYTNQYSRAHLADAAIDKVDALHEFYTYFLPQTYLSVLIPLIILIAIFPVSKICAALLMVGAPLMILFMALAGTGAESTQQKYFQSLLRLSQHFLDTVQGLATLKLLNRAKAASEKVYQYANDYRINIMKVLRIAFLSSAILELFSALSIAIVAVYLGMGFINTGVGSNLWWSLHGMNLQNALWILLLAPEFFLPLRELGTHYHAKAKAVAAFSEIEPLLSLPVRQFNYQQKLMNPTSLEFSFKKVSFQYDRGFELHDLNFSVERGEKVALVGISGSGKSTILNIMMRFLDINSGEITLNQQDFNAIHLKDYYSAIACLLQKPTLFLGTLRENLLAVNPQLSEDRLIQALQWAHVYQDLPKGLDTFVGEQGLGLSRGQIQRVALARLYLKSAALWILDEPTSSLAQNYEAMVIEALVSAWTDKTVFIATHHPALLAKVDRIIVIDQGNIIETGTYSDLMHTKNSYFHRLFAEELL